MMEIKFRAWDKENREMIERVSFEDLGIFMHLPQRYEVMQFIGLKDKNRKDIYKGDIVKIDGAKYNPWKVEFVQEACTWNFVPVKDKCANMNILESCCYRYEVIGNIYEENETPQAKAG